VAKPPLEPPDQSPIHCDRNPPDTRSVEITSEILFEWFPENQTILDIRPPAQGANHLVPVQNSPQSRKERKEKLAILGVCFASFAPWR
jgi:hypothetical protein